MPRPLLLWHASGRSAAYQAATALLEPHTCIDEGNELVPVPVAPDALVIAVELRPLRPVIELAAHRERGR